MLTLNPFYRAVLGEKSLSFPASIGYLASWYSYSAIETLYQDTAFATPVTANSDLIGSQKDRHTTGKNLIRGGTSGTELTYNTTGINSNPSATVDGADYLKAQNTTDLNYDYLDAYSIFAVIKPSDVSAAAICSKRLPGPPYTGYIFSIGLRTPGVMNFVTANSFPSNTMETNGSTVIAAGETRAVAVTVDGSSNVAGVKLYVDNALETNDVVTDLLSATTINTNPFQLCTGQGTYFYAGELGEVLVFSKELSTSELTSLYDFFQPTYGYL